MRLSRRRRYALHATWGLWGGQLQRWAVGGYDPTVPPDPSDDRTGAGAARRRGFATICSACRSRRARSDPRLARRADKAEDRERRFFEAVWVHKYEGRYYLSYSTGDTHRIVYAIGDSPYGPFTYQGVVFTPVIGWTTHHSIVAHEGRWYLFFHDASLSGGKTHLRSAKVTELLTAPMARS